MGKRILLINDLAGYGKVALSAMIPVLSHMKYEIYNLPTAIVSNTLDYGKFNILDTTEYMNNTLSVWESKYFFVLRRRYNSYVNVCKRNKYLLKRKRLTDSVISAKPYSKGGNFNGQKNSFFFSRWSRI